MKQVKLKIGSMYIDEIKIFWGCEKKENINYIKLDTDIGLVFLEHEIDIIKNIVSTLLNVPKTEILVEYIEQQ